MACEFKSHLSHQNKDIRLDVLVFLFLYYFNDRHGKPILQTAATSEKCCVYYDIATRPFPSPGTNFCFTKNGADFLFLPLPATHAAPERTAGLRTSSKRLEQNRAETGASFLQDVITNLPEILQIPVK